MKANPPKKVLAFLRWFCREDYLDEIEGDLLEIFKKHNQISPRKAKWTFAWSVIRYLRPEFIKSFKNSYQPDAYGMYKNYIKIGWRTLMRTKGYSLINIGGLAMGITITLLIGLWIDDELSFNQYHKNYQSIGQVWSGNTSATGIIEGGLSIQYPVASTLKNNYPQLFKHVLLSSWPGEHTISLKDEKFSKSGFFIEAGAADMLSLKMLSGTDKALDDPHSIILSETAARTIFGNEDPMNKHVTLNSDMEAEVRGVYEDIPKNNRFGEVQFFAPWPLWVAAHAWLQRRETDWDNRPINIYVQLQPTVTAGHANDAIKDLFAKNVPADFLATIEKDKPFVQVVPMSTWHLFSEFENGKPATGRITFVWLFGLVGCFVLLLACINFINLSTARSEKRALEVGVRKTIGSTKRQLISQFLSESFLVVLLAFTLSLVAIILLQPSFNALTDKEMTLPLDNFAFWAIVLIFIVTIGMLAGTYPAFYLSSFKPGQAIKGAFRFGRSAALPRKVLVVFQFSVSVVLIIGTLIVYQQIEFARNRPIGYDRNSLITIPLNDPGFESKLVTLRNELLNTGVVSEVAPASSPVTAVWNVTSRYDWKGRAPGFEAEFAVCNVTPDYGKTIGWTLASGRDFSRDISTDSSESVIINEAAMRYMGMENPVGQELRDINEAGKLKWSKTIIGVVRDIVMESPYESIRPTIFYYNDNASSQLHVKIKGAVSAGEALPKIKAAVERVVPAAFFDYRFVDQEFALKFGQEQAMGRLAGIFAGIAIFISCLGLFGLASYVAEQRTKEIGIRKVMGASVSNVWKMLSKDFVVLVIIAFFIAIPVAYYLMDTWLQKYQYRTEISFWIFLITGIAAMSITLLTVSFQAIKAALMNPVKSLRSE